MSVYACTFTRQPWYIAMVNIGGQPFYREIGSDPVPSSNTELQENTNESIDASVFERWRSDNAYRPQNLRQWGEKYKVDPSGLNHAVRADDPSKSV